MRAVLVLILLGAGCGGDAGPRSSATVFAAASLTEPFGELARRFGALHPGREVELHFAGTPRLVVQVLEGAPADVFASADQPSMQRVLDAPARGGARVFATNRLAIVTPRGNPKGIEGLADLARTDVTLLLCGPEVPAGRYARHSLSLAGVSARSASDEPSVRSVLTKVRLGEADAGIVYATDARTAGGEVGVIEIPREHNVRGAYPIAVLPSGNGQATGRAFVDFVLSPEGQGVLRSFGFGAP